MNIKCTEESILKEKLQFIMKYIKIVNYVYKSESRSLVVNKILKILNWSLYCNVTETRVFINICVYYWLWIHEFISIVKLIYALMKKNVFFI